MPRSSGVDRRRDDEGSDPTRHNPGRGMMLLMPSTAQAALRLTTDDADRLVGPQLVDEPAPRLRLLGEPVRPYSRQVHRRLLGAAGDFGAGSLVVGVYVSKKSFSSRCLTSRCAPVTSRSFAIVISVR